MKKYSTIRNYKKFKKEYLYFILFIKCGNYYYTFDSDARILMYLYNDPKRTLSFRIEKNKFKLILTHLLANGLNVVLAGWKNSREYYTDTKNNYMEIKRLSKIYYKSTICGVTQTS